MSDTSGPVFSVYIEDADKVLTKRELFAAMAMQGLLANPTLTDAPSGGFSGAAVRKADALLAELAKGGKV